MLYKDETVWATQKVMAVLFDCSADNIGLHLKNIYDTNEFSLRGYIIDKKRMENGSFIGEDYFVHFTWENALDGKIVKPDVSIAKYYLKQEELEDMGKLVNSVLDLAERMAIGIYQ